MFNYLPNLLASPSRCRISTIVLMAFVAFAFSNAVYAAHGATIAKDCVSPARTCDTDLDCSDQNQCTTDTCDLAISDTVVCTYTVGYNDTFLDTLSITGAWDEVFATAGIVRVPAVGNAEITAVSGNTTCIVGGTLPCLIGPTLGGGAGEVSFVSEYNPANDDVSPLTDQANIQGSDVCDGLAAGLPSCFPALTNTLQFGSAASLVSGCSSGPPTNCDDQNACTADSCDPATGQCVNAPTNCDDQNACTADSCDAATGECFHAATNCDDQNACTADSCDAATGECVNAPTNCDDQNACTADSCNATSGLCEHGAPPSCDDQNACTADSCDPANGQCVNAGNINCDDGDECTADSCDPTNGQCVNIPSAECGPTRATFEVTKHFTDGNNPTEVNVTLSCFTGLPLIQSQYINEEQGVTFVVESFDDGELDCEISEDLDAPELLGYTPTYTAGGTPGGTSDADGCYFDDVPNGAENTCAIVNDADPVPLEIVKDWIIDGVGGDQVDQRFELTLYCDSDIVDGYPRIAQVECGQIHTLVANGQTRVPYESCLELAGNGDTTFTPHVYPQWPSSHCWVVEHLYDDSVEVDNDCGNLTVSHGQGDSCLITNTVFFEGIPTMSQYGMAILALLMLGAGLIGFRRFA